MKQIWKHFLTGLCWFTILSLDMNTAVAQIRIGIFADCQYCDCEKAGNRYYRASLGKLNDCIESFNQSNDIDFVVGLGDLIDRDIQSFDPVQEVLDESKHRIYHVIGNHDLDVTPFYYPLVREKLNLKDEYYSIHKANWRFLFLNGCDICFHTQNPYKLEKAEQYITRLTEQKAPNNKKWNGAIGKEQLQWLERELIEAESKNKNVAIFCHYPIWPIESHALWNSLEIMDLLTAHPAVKVWINGHNHSGEYATHKGIHFVTLKGMVDTRHINSFSEILFADDKIEIDGFGRESSKVLRIR